MRVAVALDRQNPGSQTGQFAPLHMRRVQAEHPMQFVIAADQDHGSLKVDRQRNGVEPKLALGVGR